MATTMVHQILKNGLYESLLLKLVKVLEITQHPDGVVTPQARQALLDATNEFKTSIAQAKEMANLLPGGELLMNEQDEVIEMLERLRDRKREQLAMFASSMLSSVGKIPDKIEMEVDSMASTPALT